MKKTKQSVLQLQPEQQKVLELSPKGAVQIKGVAGSGKTTVAVYRVKYLIENYPSLFSQTNVAIFTYNRLLANYMQGLVDEVVGFKSAKVTNFHRWAYAFIEQRAAGRCANTVNGYESEKILEKLLLSLSLSIATKPITFLGEEISWIKGKYFTTETDYLDANRRGRGNDDRLSRKQKEEVWILYKAYCNHLKENGMIDFDDYATIAYELILATPNFTPPFSHIVIDEAQDLTKLQLKTLQLLVSEETNSLTIIADNAQRIYKSGFTWAEIGLDFKGRTRVLKKNYRSTIQISKAAQALLMNEQQDNDFTQIESARRGECLPIVKQLPSLKEQILFALSVINTLSDGETIFLHRSRAGVTEISEFLQSQDIKHEVSSGAQRNIGDEPIKVCTLSSVKGLEFDNVFILDCSSEYIPSVSFNSKEVDQLHLSTERRLLYTAMTRAREKLYLLYSNTRSMFLDEIPSVLVDVE